MNYAAALLDDAIAPLRPFLDAPNTEDVAMQEEGVCWIWRRGSWHREEVPISRDDMWEIIKLSGSLVHRNVDDTAPLLDMHHPRGERFFGGVAPAVDIGERVFSIRKPDSTLPLFEDAPNRYRTGGWNEWRQTKTGNDMPELLEIFRGGNLWDFLRAAVIARLPILFVGATGAGKTRMSKLSGSAMGMGERIVTIEDAKEMVLRQPNTVRFIYPSDGQGPVTVQKLQEAALRVRPDRILIQEVRQEEVAWIYVRHNGHRGSLATIHGSDASGGARNLLQLFKGSEKGRGYDVPSAIGMIAQAVDVIVPLSREGESEDDDAVVSVGPTWFSADSAARNQSIMELF